jgi:hypothetical protein
MECAVPSILAALEFFNSFQPTGVDDLANQISVKIYPNPTQNYVQVDAENATRELEGKVYDLGGRLIMQQTLPGKIDMTSFPAGFYLLRVETDQGTFTEKIIRQ